MKVFEELPPGTVFKIWGAEAQPTDDTFYVKLAKPLQDEDGALFNAVTHRGEPALIETRGPGRDIFVNAFGTVADIVLNADGNKRTRSF